jgi:glycosyltransferase involved in cell wall biosynthesis
MINKITVSAIIPVYNGADFVAEAIESVLNQNDSVEELILIDDGSTDSSMHILKRYEKKEIVKIIKKENGGQSSARNLGVKLSKSSHIAFLDQDDAWYQHHNRTLKEAFSRTDLQRKVALAYGNLDHVDRSGRMVVRDCLNGVPTKHPKTSLRECLEADMFILPGASMYEKDAFLSVDGYDERLSGYEDDDLNLRLFAAGFESIYINKSITKWRIYSGSTSFSERMTKSRMIYFKKLIELYPDEPRMSLYWSRDLVAPRFATLVQHDFNVASRLGDEKWMKKSLKDMEIIANFLRSKKKKRFNTLKKIVELTANKSTSGLSRKLLSIALK